MSFRIKRGDTYSESLTFTASGSAVDITGATVFFTVKEVGDTESDDSGALITKDITTHSDPANGITTLAFTADDTDQTPGDYEFEIQIKYADGSIKSTNTGVFSILSDVTKRTS